MTKKPTKAPMVFPKTTPARLANAAKRKRGGNAIKRTTAPALNWRTKK